jgi:hypothetical protein
MLACWLCELALPQSGAGNLGFSRLSSRLVGIKRSSWSLLEEPAAGRIACHKFVAARKETRIY